MSEPVGSPNGLDVTPDARKGYLGGGISKKIIILVGGGLFLLIMFILYVISQKGQHDTEVKEDTPVVEEQVSGGRGTSSNGGLNEILATAPDDAIVTHKVEPKVTPTTDTTPPPKKPAPNVPRNEQTAPTDTPKETDAERRARLAQEQEVERIKQRKMQSLQAALVAKSDVNMDLGDDTQSSATDGAVSPKAAVSLPEPDWNNTEQSDPNKQEVKLAFSEKAHSNTYLTQGREIPLSPYELKVGTLIPATMISGVNSDLPGQVIASVSQNVYDSATGGHLLLPQGAKLYGLYDSQIAYGQDRVLMAWTRVNYPDGTTLELEGMGAIDSQGFAGFEDQVDHHYWKIFGNAFILGMITGVSEAGINDNSSDVSTAESINNGVTEQFAETGSTLIEKNLDVQPTIVIRNGYKFNIMLNKDIVLKPYQPY
ncbi:TrbI/VirB10 family protein [Vibrio parahaemolyticus]|uniref:TrbI/VirB10 family protein n=1 Tax=Vibrio parahaemolyticus TaxID=670 RepID=UPI000D52FD00|nr:TrbI/VirB10 family protein [Vibrio parahaemolyticus]AWG82271.1 conjugal transfer protein TrbI [Vibrio parahaemolyticus]AWJ81851.1 conjugal transfer protein TrbI [Vibrio parahaemolyticus]